MYFAKNEIVELDDGKKYLVIDTALVDDKSYYLVKQVSEDLKTTTGDKKIITVEEEDTVLYINEIIPEKDKLKLNEIFN